jgi:hypothetical protein
VGFGHAVAMKHRSNRSRALYFQIVSILEQEPIRAAAADRIVQLIRDREVGVKLPGPLAVRRAGRLLMDRYTLVDKRR